MVTPYEPNIHEIQIGHTNGVVSGASGGDGADDNDADDYDESAMKSRNASTASVLRGIEFENIGNTDLFR
jgi:hypothetical protein